jgi:hypothetical protein
VGHGIPPNKGHVPQGIQLRVDPFALQSTPTSRALSSVKLDRSHETSSEMYSLPPYRWWAWHLWTFIKLIGKVTLSFTPYPLFQWYSQSKEIFIKSQYEMLKLSIYCIRFESNYNSYRGGSVKIYVAPVEALRKRGDGTHFTTQKNWWKN